MLLVGYFEGIDSERGIAWRAADSFALRSFLGYELHQPTADHTTISRTRRLIDVETHRSVFTWVLGMLAEEGLLKGNTVAIDGTTLEANAALRSIVRRDNGTGYEDFLTGLAKESGIETPTREQLAKLDRKRPKKGSNDDWVHPQDPDAQITKMKDGRTHLAHKAEHAVDLETGAVVAVTLQPATAGDTNTVCETLAECGEHIREVAVDTSADPEETVNPEDRPNWCWIRVITAMMCCWSSKRSASEFIVRNRIEDGATGRRKRRSRERFTRTAGAFAANGESGCYGSVENGSNAASLICMRRARCGELICAGMKISSNGC